jgi:hypothetical protein
VARSVRVIAVCTDHPSDGLAEKQCTELVAEDTSMNARWFAAFSFLVIAVHEGHEFAQALAGRIVCNEWPVRDFNSWHFVGACSSWWPTAIGPLFSYALMLLGGIVVVQSTKFRSVGLVVLFAANPFARIFTAAMGGGDEMVVAQRLAGLAERTSSLRIAVAMFVLVVCGAPLVTAWRAMKGLRGRGWWFAANLIWPMVLTGVALFVAGNRMLKAGMLREPHIGGAPLLVVLVSGAAVLLAIVTRRWLVAETAHPTGSAVR